MRIDSPLLLSSSLNGGCTVTGSLTISGSSDITGSQDITGSSNVSGSIDVVGPIRGTGSISIIGPGTITGSLGISQGVTIGGTLVGSSANFTGPITASLISASIISASFYSGDGSGLTGLSTNDWDGQRNGDSSITGSLTVTGPIQARGEYQLINPASGSVTVDWESGSMFELNVTDNISLTLTGSYAGGDHKLLLKNTQTGSAPSITWTNPDFFYNSSTLPSAVAQASGYVGDSDFLPTNTYANSAVYDFVRQSDGKIVLVGGFTTISGSTSNRIVRVNPSGSIDSTFNVGDGFNNNALRVIQQSDDKLVVIGQFTQYSGSSVNRIVRINTDGTKDDTFDLGTGFNSQFNFSTFGSTTGIEGDILQQSDGKLVVGGPFTQYSGSTANNIVRINSDGKIDADFAISGSGFRASSFPDVFKLALQSDGKILVGGKLFSGYSGSSTSNIFRINTSGSLDSTFNPGTVTIAGALTNLIVQGDNKIIVAGGDLTEYSGSAVSDFLRANSDGTLDSDFNNNNTTQFGTYHPLSVVLRSGSIFVGPHSTSALNSLYQFNNSGSLVNTIQRIQGVTLGPIFKLQFEPGSDKLLIGGSFSNPNNPGGFIRVKPNTNALLYNNYNVYYNGSYYFVDVSDDDYIYERDPNAN